MKQIFQNLKTGKIETFEVPVPSAASGKIVVNTTHSLISVGTERMLVKFGKSGIIAKAKQQPEKVKQVLDKMKTDGFVSTLTAVQAKLDEPLPLGYCNVGEIVELGEEISQFKIGDRVLSNGPHAEYVSVGKNLCVKIPDNVSSEDAVFTVLGSIALQSIRLAKSEIGETFAVFGLGLIGLLTTQILIAHGCKVICFDFNQNRINLAEQFGAIAFNLEETEDPVKTAVDIANGKGVDGVIIAASTSSSEPVHQAAQMCRKRGRIILSGVTGLELNRSDFYEKELSFQVSCSYGPGRYDEGYEVKGNDYPFGYVRWTEQRNFSAVLELLAASKINVKPLITDVIEFRNAKSAYERILSDSNVLGLILKYRSEIADKEVAIKHFEKAKKEKISKVVVGAIGAGNFARQILYPALCKTDAYLKMVSDINPSSAAYAARKFGFQYSSSDVSKIIGDPDINTVFILTRHNTHADLVIESLKAGKNVYVEKPLALTKSDLNSVKKIYNESNGRLMVGFNRRFSPQIVKIKELLANRTSPISVVYVVNAGAIPEEHWVHDLTVGGGRIIGEGCHFIDLISFLADSDICSVSAFSLGEDKLHDKVMINLEMDDGSIGSVHYLANGSKRYPKETIQIFCEGKVLSLINFRKLYGYGWKGFSKYNLLRQDKGHNNEILQFINNITVSQDELIPFNNINNVTAATFSIIESISNQQVVQV